MSDTLIPHLEVEIKRQKGMFHTVNARCDSLGVNLRDIMAERICPSSNKKWHA